MILLYPLSAYILFLDHTQLKHFFQFTVCVSETSSTIKCEKKKIKRLATEQLIDSVIPCHWTFKQWYGFTELYELWKFRGQMEAKTGKCENLWKITSQGTAVHCTHCRRFRTKFKLNRVEILLFMRLELLPIILNVLHRWLVPPDSLRLQQMRVPGHVINVHVWNMWAMCGQLIHNPHHQPSPQHFLTPSWEGIAAAPCFPALSERGGREQGMERVTSLSVRPGLSQGDHWKADVTQCVGASESGRKKRMGSFIFRGRGGKSERWLREWCLLLRSERLALAAVATVWKVL